MENWDIARPGTRRRGPLAPLAALVAVALAAASAPVAAQATATTPPAAQSQVTAYQSRLQAHADRITAIRARMEEIGDAPAGPKREGDVRRVGADLLAEARALQATVTAFLQGETRRGLDTEIALVRAATSGVAQGVIDYRQLSGAEITFVWSRDRSWALTVGRQIVVERLPAWVENKWAAAALQDVVSAKNAADLKAKVTTRLRNDVTKIVDAETKRLLGVAFHDRRSLQRALRERVNAELDRRVTALLFSLGGEGVVVQLLGSTVVSLVRDAFWNQLVPAIKELARGKGNVDQRVTKSIATMEAARTRLFALAPDADLTQTVAPALRNANNTITASRYLVNDLKRQKKSALLVNLGGAITDLERARTLTIRRFLLDKVEAVQRLAGDRAVLDDAVNELAALVKAPSGQPVTATGRFLDVAAEGWADTENSMTLSWTSDGGAVTGEGVHTHSRPAVAGCGTDRYTGRYRFSGTYDAATSSLTLTYVVQYESVLWRQSLTAPPPGCIESPQSGTSDGTWRATVAGGVVRHDSPLPRFELTVGAAPG